jgi:hydroxymethylglutaryl-CoA lyase
MNGLGIVTGIDFDRLFDAGQFISNYLQRKPASKAAAAFAAKRAREAARTAKAA